MTNEVKIELSIEREGSGGWRVTIQSAHLVARGATRMSAIASAIEGWARMRCSYCDGTGWIGTGSRASPRERCHLWPKCTPGALASGVGGGPAHRKDAQMTESLRQPLPADGSGEDEPARIARQAAVGSPIMSLVAHADDDGHLHIFARAADVSSSPIFLGVAELPCETRAISQDSGTQEDHGAQDESRSDASRLRIRGCAHDPPHASFDACPENDAWMAPGSNVPAPDRFPRPATFADGDRVFVASWAKREGIVRGWRGDIGQWWIELPSYFHAFEEKYLQRVSGITTPADSEAAKTLLSRVAHLADHKMFLAEAAYVLAEHRRAAETKHLRTAWPPREVVDKLSFAVSHLLADHDCDMHGRELVRAALDKAYEWLRTSPGG